MVSLMYLGSSVVHANLLQFLLIQLATRPCIIPSNKVQYLV